MLSVWAFPFQLLHFKFQIRKSVYIFCFFSVKFTLKLLISEPPFLTQWMNVHVLIAEQSHRGKVGWQHCNLCAAADWETHNNHSRWFILKGQRLMTNHYSTALTKSFNYFAHSLTHSLETKTTCCLHSLLLALSLHRTLTTHTNYALLSSAKELHHSYHKLSLWCLWYTHFFRVPSHLPWS